SGTLASRPISPSNHRGESNLRDVAKAGGAFGFLSVDSNGGTNQTVKGGGSVSPSPSRPPMDAASPQTRPREAVTNIRDLEKSKGAVGFLSIDPDGESRPPQVADDPNSGIILHNFAKSKGAVGFMTFGCERSLFRFGKKFFVSHATHHISQYKL